MADKKTREASFALSDPKTGKKTVIKATQDTSNRKVRKSKKFFNFYKPWQKNRKTIVLMTLKAALSPRKTALSMSSETARWYKSNLQGRSDYGLQ